MANIKSAIKRAKISKIQRERNNAVKSVMKTDIKKFYTASAEDSSELYSSAVSSIDKAVAKGVIHKNAAAHKKASLAKELAAK